MENISVPQSPTNATYVEPSSETILEPGLKLGDLLHRNMTQPYVLQRLRKRVWWVQSFGRPAAASRIGTTATTRDFFLMRSPRR